MTERQLNFDFEGFYRALDATRESRKLNWKQVAAETDVHPSTLTRMASNKRPDADGLAALAAWSGLNPADFVAAAGASRASRSDSLARISKLLREDDRLSATNAKTLEEIVKTAYSQLAKRS